MIDGAHFLLYSKDAEADRRFLAEVLELRSVDVGHGWLIFGLPPSELAVHPADRTFTQDQAGHSMAGAILYLMCDDIHAEIAALRKKNVMCPEPEDAGWGIKTSIPLPGGSEIGLYQPRHARP